MSDKAQKFQEIMTLLSDSLTRKDFEEAFKSLIDFIKRTDKGLTEKIEGKTEDMQGKFDRLEDFYRETMRKLEEDNGASFADIRQWVTETIERQFLYHEGRVDRITERLNAIETLPSAEDIAMEASTMAYSELLPSIPKIEDIEKDLPKLGAPIRDGLELLEDGEKLKIEAIQDLREELDELRRWKATHSLQQSHGHSIGGHVSHTYNLSPYLDGTTKTFSIPSMWEIQAVLTSSFPNVLLKTDDFTHNTSNHTITFTDQILAAGTLANGQSVLILYSSTI